MNVKRIDGGGIDEWDAEAGFESEAIADAVSVRRAVFVEEQGVPEAKELDGRDGEAIHFVAYDDSEPVGTARLRAADGADGTAKAERVAVRAERRDQGIGRLLMRTVEDAARTEGYETVVLHAQLPVVEFYERLDYGTVGERFEEAGIPHRKMKKPL